MPIDVPHHQPRATSGPSVYRDRRPIGVQDKRPIAIQGGNQKMKPDPLGLSNEGLLITYANQHRIFHELQDRVANTKDEATYQRMWEAGELYDAIKRELLLRMEST